MMAAEATSEKPVDVSVTDASLSQTTASDESQHLNAEAPNSPTVNGTDTNDEPERLKAVNDIVDELVNSAEVSVSGGSDTEASTSKGKDGGHARNSSAVKKPQTFKSVSVNRTFLGAKNPANAASRSETSSPALTPATPATNIASASRLKLVAKSGSSLGGASKTLTTNGKAPGAPDGSTVWNRNKPAPMPEPKKLSDEELKKYGIHISDRLRPEDSSNQNNWADEDDDDDDWAPDTITWTDGTKITLENQPTPSTAPAVPVITSTPAYVPPVADKPKSPAPGVTSGSARASPSVKPSLMASGKSLVLKGAPEKPTLVAKAPAPPTPVKSPWATLPPVDKALSVLMDLPNQQQHQQQPPIRGYPPRDPALAKSATPPPAKEIAADDFTRSHWRDGPAGGSRELFNSQSGRYEPVHDRRSSRHDISQRHPALLQRPLPHQDSQGPAEPSAAFQTNRTSGQDTMPYGRRRNSSNVSGGSGGLMHRLGKSHDVGPSEQNTPIPSQPSPARSQYAQPWQSRPSPGSTNAVPVGLHAPNDLPATAATVPTPSEDDVELQKRLMRERREMAIKRRLEEEAKEEAARKERIRLKLEAMGPAPERKSTKKDESRDVPTKRDVPTATIFSKEDLAAAAAERATPTHTSLLEKQEIDSANAEQNVNGDQPTVPSESAQPGQPSSSQSTATWPEAAQKSTDRLPTWNSASQSTSRNVWAAPGNDRSLGNGTFSADLGQLANSEPTQPASMIARPTPIGPPRSTSHGQGQRTEQQSGRLAPIGPPSSNRPGAASAHTTNAPRRNLWATADIAADDRAIRLEKQKQAEEYRKSLEGQGMSTNEARQTVRDTWRGVDIDHDGKRVSTQVMTAHHGDKHDRQGGLSWDSSAPGPHQEHVRHEPQLLHHPSPHHGYRHQHGVPDGVYSRTVPLGPAGAVPAPGTISQSRAGSRFFPNQGPRDVRQEEVPVQARSKSPTPPPPTEDGHPAYDGNVERPHVALPPTRPIVKLPPVAVKLPPVPKQVPLPMIPPKPATFAAAAAAATTSRSATAALAPGRGANYGGQHQTAGEIKKQENWQEKINSLVRASPAKPISVDSSSKYAFDAHANTSATVSLPALSPTWSSSSESSAITTKEMAEECFDEQEMGSLPPVNLPTEAPFALWPDRAVEPNWLPLHIRYRIDAVGSESLRFPYEVVNHKSVYRILTPGMDEPKTVVAPFGFRNRSNPRRQGRGSRGSRGSQRNGRGDSYSDHQNVSPTSDRPERSERSERMSSRGGRGNYRARSENWTRNSSSLAQPMQS